MAQGDRGVPAMRGARPASPMIAAMWSIVLLVTFADGDVLRLGFNSMETCREIQAQYLARPEVVAVGECRKG